MKRLSVVPIDFVRCAEGSKPADQNLFDMVIAYCKENLREQPKLTDLAKTWAVVEFDGDSIVAVHGVAAYGGNVPDIPVFRVTGENAKRATQMLYDRMNGFFADNGMRGKQVFLYISDKEKPEQRCPAWEESIKDVGAIPAERFAVAVR